MTAIKHLSTERKKNQIKICIENITTFVNGNANTNEKQIIDQLSIYNNKTHLFQIFTKIYEHFKLKKIFIKSQIKHV